MLRELPVVRERGVCCELPIQVDPKWAEERAKLLKAIADPTRVSMLACLMATDSAICICDFTQSLDLSQPTVSHHMAKLRDAGFVEAEKRGIWMHYRLRDVDSRTRTLLRALVGG